MDYLYREKLLAYTRGLQPRNCVLLDVEGEEAAIREAQLLVGRCTVPCVGGLFSLEDDENVRPIRGWRKDESDKVKYLGPDEVKEEFKVTKHTFDRCRPGTGDLETCRTQTDVANG